MKKFLFGLLSIICLLGCKKKQDDIFYDILDDNFLVLTDTVAYEYHTFFLTPNDPIKPDRSTFKGYKVCIDKRIAPLDVDLGRVIEELETGNYSEYLKLLNEKSKFKLDTIDLSKLKKTGKFEIVDLANCKMDRTSRDNYVGSMIFYQPFINEHHAILYYLKQSSPKGGVFNVFLFKKEDNHWKTEKKIEIGRI